MMSDNDDQIQASLVLTYSTNCPTNLKKLTLKNEEGRCFSSNKGNRLPFKADVTIQWTREYHMIKQLRPTPCNVVILYELRNYHKKIV